MAQSGRKRKGLRLSTWEGGNLRRILRTGGRDTLFNWEKVVRGSGSVDAIAEGKKRHQR